jgi:hypothetical protein
MRAQPPQRDPNSRFRGRLRHYHRSGVRKNQSWEEWVYGSRARTLSLRKWLRIAGVLIALLALGGIIVGLFIELR